MSQEPAAIQLRYLQILTEIAAEKNSTIIFPMPLEFLRVFSGVGQPLKAPVPPSMTDEA